MKKVYACFCTDVIHEGHLNIIHEAKKYGKVIAGVLSDAAMIRYNRFPTVSFEERKKMLEQIPEVDEVVVQNEVMYGNILEQIKPDYVIHGDNWLNDPMEVIRDNVIENLAKWGGQLIEVPYTYNEQVKNIEAVMRERAAMPEYRRKRLRQLIKLCPIVKTLEVHSGLTGLIAEKTDTFFKRFTAQAFYKVLMRMGVETVYNHADYRLISARVLKEFAGFKEVNLFLRGMIPLVGFKSTSVFYERHERIAGESHYPLAKMVNLAIDGITSLSVKPLRLISGLGIGVSVLSFVGVLWAVITQICGRTVTGWASTVCVICFMGGVQLVCLGVLGEYIGKIYMEVKARPRYIISERTWTKQNEDEEKGE